MPEPPEPGDPPPTVGIDDETFGATRRSDDGLTGRNGPASLTLPDLELVPGEKIELTGDGWLPGSTVNIWLFSSPVLLGTSTVDEQGTFTQTVRVPDDIAAGDHTVVVTGLDADGLPRKVSIPIKIVAAAGGAVIPTSQVRDPRLLAAVTGPTGPLAQTGGGALTLGVRGVLLLLLGGLGVRAGGRRESRAQNT